MSESMGLATINQITREGRASQQRNSMCKGPVARAAWSSKKLLKPRERGEERQGMERPSGGPPLTPGPYQLWDRVWLLL